MKHIAVYFDQINFDEFIEKEEYKTSYKELAEIIQKKGGRFYVYHKKESYFGNSAFENGLVYDEKEKKFVQWKKRVKIDAVYIKGNGEVGDEIPAVNTNDFTKKWHNKETVCRTFPHLSPKTMIIRSKKEEEKAFLSITCEKVVVKPLDAYGGRGVHIDSPEKIRNCLPEYPFLLQEFIDTSDGIPHITKSTHDFRIVGINGKVIFALVRTPPEGSLLANVSQGGSLMELAKERIPKKHWIFFMKSTEN